MEQDAGPKPDVGAGRGPLAAFFSSNPWVGMVGTAASIVGVFLAIYFYIGSRSYPELVYLVNPVHTIVVKQGTASRLGVIFDGQPITQDVTASQVALWNRGRQAIRRAAILQAVTITTEPSVPILEATVRRTSRNVVSFDLDRTGLAKGEVSVSWNILEEGDGGVLQLVYAGDVGTQIVCRGIIEGQRGVRELKMPQGYIESPESQFRSQRFERYFILVQGLLILVIGPLNFIRWRDKIDPSHGWSRLGYLLYYLGMPIVFGGLCVYLFLSRAVPAPPLDSNSRQ